MSSYCVSIGLLVLRLLPKTTPTHGGMESNTHEGVLCYLAPRYQQQIF